MTHTKFVPICSLLFASILFATSVDAQVAPPTTEGVVQLQGQSSAAPTVNLSDSVTSAGCGSECSTGCNQGCEGACDQGCGQRLRLLGRLTNSMPSGGSCGCSSYRSIFGGWSGLDDLSVPVVGAGTVNGTFNDGFLLGTARGRYINDRTRIEMEGTWRANSGESFDGGMGPVLLDGHFNNYSTMVNVVRDFPSNGPLNLYAGLGAGVSRQDGDFVANGNSIVFDDWAFAYQALAGVNVKRSQQTDLFAEFRYFGNAETQYEFNGADAGPFKYVAENIVFGIRFKR